MIPTKSVPFIYNIMITKITQKHDIDQICIHLDTEK